MTIRDDILRAIEDALDAEELLDILDLSVGDLLNGRFEEVLEENIDKVLEHMGYEQSDDDV